MIDIPVSKMTDYCDRCRDEIYKDGKYLMCKILYDSQSMKDKLNVNLDDFGRVRNFIRNKFSDWNDDPIPIDIAISKLKLPVTDRLDVQMIEVGKCNLHCWWCYLPDEIRVVNDNYMKWFSASSLIDKIIAENNNCNCIYISGGNPELVPEIVYDFMKELEKKKLSNKILLWSDDVLTTDYLLNLEDEKLQYMIKYKNYAKVCCLKGFDEDSFSFNTLLDKQKFYNQLDRLEKYIKLGFDVYTYIVFTCETMEKAEEKIIDLIHRLQSISYYLPLRVIPIKIEEFSAVKGRLNPKRKQSLVFQYEILKIWNKRLKEIYPEYGKVDITSLNLKKGIRKVII